MERRCPSCGHALPGSYCTNCGEARADRAQPGKRSFAARLRASLDALASPPGRLTRDWIDGKRVGYLAPVPLFLYTNIAFFLVQWASGVSVLSWPLGVHLTNNIFGIAQPLAAWYPGPGAIKNPRNIAVFNALEVVHAKALVIVMLPMFALPVLGVRLEGRREFARALAFSANFFTFALIALCALFPVVALALAVLAKVAHPLPAAIDDVVTTLQALIFGGYLYVALRTLTRLPAWRRLLFTAWLLLMFWIILLVYHDIVFATTLLTL